MAKPKVVKNTRGAVQFYFNDDFHSELKMLALQLSNQGYYKIDGDSVSNHIKVNDLLLEAAELLKKKYKMKASPYNNDSSRIHKP